MPQTMKPRTIFITGASSGIGGGLARHYAAPGCTLYLSGPDQGRLEQVCQDCHTKGAEAQGLVLCVNDRVKMEQCIRDLDQKTPFDLVIANAGISGGVGDGRDEDPTQVRAIFDTNITGVLNTILPILPAFKTRGKGQLAIVSSLAGFKGLPTAPAYCAAKAAVRVWGEGLRLSLAPHNIRVSVITPGFVVSRMTAVNQFKMPFLMPAEEAARRIARGLEHNQARIAFPWPFVIATQLFSLLPPSLSDWISTRLPAKERATKKEPPVY